MAKLRFYTTLITSLPYAIYALPKAEYMIAHKDVYNREIRYKFVREICKRVRIHASTSTALVEDRIETKLKELRANDPRRKK